MKETLYERYLGLRQQLDKYRIDNPVSHIEAMEVLKQEQIKGQEIIKQAYLDWREGKISDSINIEGVIYQKPKEKGTHHG